jgi:hypothetical protein
VVPGHHSRSLTDRRSDGARPCRQSACPGRWTPQSSCRTSKVKRARRWPGGDHRCTGNHPGAGRRSLPNHHQRTTGCTSERAPGGRHVRISTRTDFADSIPMGMRLSSRDSGEEQSVIAPKALRSWAARLNGPRRIRCGNNTTIKSSFCLNANCSPCGPAHRRDDVTAAMSTWDPKLVRPCRRHTGLGLLSQPSTRPFTPPAAPAA